MMQYFLFHLHFLSEPFSCELFFHPEFFFCLPFKVNDRKKQTLTGRLRRTASTGSWKGQAKWWRHSAFAITFWRYCSWLVTRPWRLGSFTGRCCEGREPATGVGASGKPGPSKPSYSREGLRMRLPGLAALDSMAPVMTDLLQRETICFWCTGQSIQGLESEQCHHLIQYIKWKKKERKEAVKRLNMSGKVCGQITANESRDGKCLKARCSGHRGLSWI